MNRKEISEIFSLWSLNWPNAEMFQGDRNLLNARITLYANRLQEVSYWFGRKGALISIDTRRFPPNIAEYREDISKAKAASEMISGMWFDQLRFADTRNGLEAAYTELPQPVQEIVDEMGGMKRVYIPGTQILDGTGFEAAYIRLQMRRENWLPAGENRERRLP